MKLCVGMSVSRYADMHMSVLFITCPRVVSTLAVDTAKFVEIIAGFAIT